jgi:hypothetical protein
MITRVGVSIAIAALLIAGCATTKAPLWPTGLAPADAREISALIHHETKSSEHIYAYSPQPDGTLLIFMGEHDQSGHNFIVQRINGKWKIIKEYVWVS